MAVANVKVEYDADTSKAEAGAKRVQASAEAAASGVSKAYAKASAVVETFSSSVGKITGLLGNITAATQLITNAIGIYDKLKSYINGAKEAQDALNSSVLKYAENSEIALRAGEKRAAELAKQQQSRNEYQEREKINEIGIKDAVRNIVRRGGKDGLSAAVERDWDVLYEAAGGDYYKVQKLFAENKGFFSGKLVGKGGFGDTAFDEAKARAEKAAEEQAAAEEVLAKYAEREAQLEAEREQFLIDQAEQEKAAALAEAEAAKKAAEAKREQERLAKAQEDYDVKWTDLHASKISDYAAVKVSAPGQMNSFVSSGGLIGGVDPVQSNIEKMDQERNNLLRKIDEKFNQQYLKLEEWRREMMGE